MFKAELAEALEDACDAQVVMPVVLEVAVALLPLIRATKLAWGIIKLNITINNGGKENSVLRRALWVSCKAVKTNESRTGSFIDNLDTIEVKLHVVGSEETFDALLAILDAFNLVLL